MYAFFAIKSTSAQVNLNQGLAAYWNFNGNANDISGNNNNGIVNGATLTSDRWGNPNGAYYFNGINNFIQVSTSPTLNFSSDTFTIYAVVKVSGYYQGTCHGNSIIGRGANDLSPGAFYLRYADNYYTNGQNCANAFVYTLHENFYTGCSNIFTPSVIPPQYIQNDNWYCIVAVNDGTHLKMYVNGVLDYDAILNGNFSGSNSDYFIGTRNIGAYPYWLTGVIDEIRLYNRALNANEVQALCDCSWAQNNNALLNNDTTICGLATIPLLTDNLIDTNAIFWWSPTATLSDSTSLNPIASPLVSTEYFFNLLNPGCNIINNADFESGNVGFTSQYIYTPLNVAGGEYFVGPNSLAWNPWLGSFGDHTTGSGNMLLVNGSPVPNTSVWCKTLTVTPNTDYVFSAWIQNINIWGAASNPAILQFSVNGNLLGNAFTTTVNAGIWQQFYQTWNSGANTTATICLVDQNVLLSGNDFAIDDILFAPYTWQQDSVTITLSPPITIVASPAVTICSGQSTQLNASGGISYVWSPNIGLNNPNISNPVSNVAITTTYTVTGTDANGCSNTSSVTVSVNPTLSIIANAVPPAVCEGDQTVLSGSGGISYTWSGGIADGVAFTPLVTTTYTVTGTDGNGCTNTSSVTVSVNSLPNISANAVPPAVCEGDQTILNGSGGISYTWSGGIVDGIAFTPLVSGTYTVTGTDANGCINTASTMINVSPKPNIFANANPPAVCPGNPAILTGSGGISYIWSGGITDGVSFIPAATATYTVTGTSANGCTATSTVTLTVNAEIPITIAPDNPVICIGESIQLTASGAANYTWANTPGLNTYTGPVVIASPVINTTYTVTGIDANGCTGTSTVYIDVSKSIEIQITKSRDVECENNIVELQANGAQNYSWSPANLLSNAFASVTNASVVQTTTFYVTGNTCSCVDVDSITVYYYNNDETGIIVPNAFTPNGDGLNDCLRIMHNANFTKYYFTVYNRWGEMVFETNDPNACWNGEHKNTPAQFGTYFYYLKAQTVCGQIFKKGDIIIIR